VVISVEETKLDTGGAIKKAILDHVKEDEPLIITNGDTFWPNLNLEEMCDEHQKMGGKATLLYVPLKTPWGISTLDESGKVIHFGEKKVIEGMWVSGGVYISDRSLVDLLPDVGPIEGEPFETLTDRGELYGYKYLDFWRAIDTAKDQTEVEKYLSETSSSSLQK
jgi:mannose-1-phosphate guanylyltransferase